MQSFQKQVTVEQQNTYVYILIAEQKPSKNQYLRDNLHPPNTVRR